LVNDEVFKSNANKFIASEFSFKDTQVTSSKVDPKTHTIELALIGLPLKQSTLKTLKDTWRLHNLKGQNYCSSNE
jgi:hypothetical protein